MQRITERGIEVLIPPDTSRRRTTRRNWEGGRYDQMRELLATERGGELYRKRQPMIEPVFAHTKFNRGLDRFRRRGRGAVRAEWRPITATHNLLDHIDGPVVIAVLAVWVVKVTADQVVNVIAVRDRLVAQPGPCSCSASCSVQSWPDVQSAGLAGLIAGAWRSMTPSS
jgi:hypothetical protein